MNIKNNILETIGNTPMIRLNKITKDFPCTVVAKVDYFNPGNSIKDRMALKMVEVAEQERALGVFFDTLVVCSVTGSSHAGLIVGAVAEGKGRCVLP